MFSNVARLIELLEDVAIVIIESRDGVLNFFFTSYLGGTLATGTSNGYARHKSS